MSLLTLAPGYAQNTQEVAFMATIELVDSKAEPRGLLYDVMDSALVLLVHKDPSSAADNSYLTIPASQIYRIKLRPKGNVSRSAKKGVLYGTLIGAALGGLQGAAYESDPWTSVDTGEFIIAGAVSGAMSGALYGAIIGSIKSKVVINGSYQRFKYQRDLLKSKAYNLSQDVSTPTDN